MANRPAPFKITDVQRAIKAGQSLGLPVTGYAIGADGTIIVHTGQDDGTKLSPLEAWKANRGTS